VFWGPLWELAPVRWQMTVQGCGGWEGAKSQGTRHGMGAAAAASRLTKLKSVPGPASMDADEPSISGEIRGWVGPGSAE
jgi:hypothetical protein